MHEYIVLEELSCNGVRIKKETYLAEPGEEPAKLGDTWRVELKNSKMEREMLKECLSEPYYSTVMSLWGEIPSVIDPEPTEI